MKSLLAIAILAAAPVAAPVGASAQQASAFAAGAGQTQVTLTVKFGNSARFNGRYFRPTAIVEDSRCPPNANCVWAGRLVIDARYAGRKVRMELGQPIKVRGGTLTLIDATAPGPAGTKLAPYRYRFEVRFEA